MAVKIKLKRMGKIRTPHYRIIVADSRTRRDGRAIEEIGLYNPKLEPSLIKVDSERAQYWLGVGAQPTDPVMAILKVTGDWQKFKGLPGAEGTLKVADPKAEKRAAFDAALAEVHGESKDDAATKKSAAKKTTAKKSTAKKSTAKKTTAKKSADGADAKADEAADAKAEAADAKAADTKAADAKATDAKAESADDAAATATDDAAAAKDEA